jgi:hypothetical protein
MTSAILFAAADMSGASLIRHSADFGGKIPPATTSPSMGLSWPIQQPARENRPEPAESAPVGRALVRYFP